MATTTTAPTAVFTSSNGIGGYDLQSPHDRAFAFDYESSGKLDHLVLIRPGTGTAYIVRRQGSGFEPVYAQGVGGIGTFDLALAEDRAFAFDYESSGKLDHIVLIRPSTGVVYIVKRRGNAFEPVFAQVGASLGGFTLGSNDQTFAYDYDSSGKLDHLVLLRPGSGSAYIVKRRGGVFEPVYIQGNSGAGIGGYDLHSIDDKAFAYDYDSSGKLDHIVLTRPGRGAAFVVKRRGATFEAVYAQGDGGGGIGGYDLRSARDRGFAFDYTSSGKLDHMVFTRPVQGAAFIIRRNGSSFAPVYSQGDGGIGGYDLRSPDDIAFAFDYESSGKRDHIVLMRPGQGICRIVDAMPGAAPVVKPSAPGPGRPRTRPELER